MSVNEIIDDLKHKMQATEVYSPMPFNEFVAYATRHPNNVFRNIFQLFADMIQNYVGEGYDEYPNDPDSINYINYDTTRLFTEDSENPFFADTPFANRLVNLTRTFRSGAQRNKIYIFEGPAGSGKSTFLNNIFRKFEEYTAKEAGLTYELVWFLDKQKVGGYRSWEEMATGVQGGAMARQMNGSEDAEEIQHQFLASEMLEVPCPNHCNPFMVVPKQYRKEFIWQIIEDEPFRKRVFSTKEFEWLFKDELCTICSSLYHTLLDRVSSLDEIFNMIYARPVAFNRRLGEGITIYSPGDVLLQEVQTNIVLQKMLNVLLRDSNAVQYIFSEYARTNNGIYAIMDVKSNNKERLLNLHGIISDSIHKVRHIEESINSLFVVLMNPEDKEVVESVKSLGDRVLRIPIPYVLDYHTEVQIYFNKFGRQVAEKFLPRVLDNFARVVISSRLNRKSKNMREWIKEPDKYRAYCDKDMLLLKMDLYTGIIPPWISEEDRKGFNPKRRQNIIGESAFEGQDENSISGRQSIELFSEFYTKYSKDERLIDMAKVFLFCKEKAREIKCIPEGFLESLVTLYNYNVLQEIKESLYSYNEREIGKDIMNYLFAVNFDSGTKVTSIYTGDEIEVADKFLKRIEEKLLGKAVDAERQKFRAYVQREYTSKTLTEEIGINGKTIKHTALYKLLLDKYQHHLKEDVLTPFLENDNFRNAIRDFGTPDFKSYDKKIIRDVRFLMRNLKNKHHYTEEGAKQICIYVIDNEIPQLFAKR